MRTVKPLSALAIAGLLAGCASVKVMKVQPAAGEKDPEGIPFYLPRPYVQVYEPFVISSKAYLASGQLTTDGQFLLLDPLTGDLASVFSTQSRGTDDVRFPVRDVRVTSPGSLGSIQSGSDTDAGKDAKPADGTQKDDAKKDQAKKDDGKSDSANQASSAPVGQFNTSVTQAPVPFPATLGRRFFDVIWMPDFDEKYVVQGSPGLGNANIGVTLTQGWGLYGLDARIDNSAVVKPLLDFYTGVAGALTKVAQAKINPAAALTGSVQSGSDGRTPERLASGTRVTVKVTKVTVAAPGLYPVLKPSETAAKGTADRGNGTVLIPTRPYTNVAFNTYEVLVVEAAKPAGDSPMNLQRFYDVDAQGNTVATPAAPVQGNRTALNANEFTNRVNDILKNRKSADNAVWVVSNVRVEDQRLKLTATLTGGKQKPAELATKDALQNFLSLQSNFPAGTIDIEEK